MDPRLWEMLNSPPGELFIRRISLLCEGQSLEVECETFNDSHPHGKKFRMVFSNCRDIRWESSDPYMQKPEVQAFGMYLGEELHGKPAVVYTGGTEMSVLYDEVYIAD
jgi:hypothetical protein